MTKLINKLLSYFNLKLVSTKLDKSLVDETMKYLNRLGDLRNDSLLSPYVGDIVYLQERVKGEFPQVSGKTYIRQNGGEDKYFCDYEGGAETPSKEEFMEMYEKTTFTSEELDAKLK